MCGCIYIGVYNIYGLYIYIYIYIYFPGGYEGRDSLYRAGHLEKGMAAHSSILAWRIPWTEEPGRLQSMGSQIARHN